MDIPNNIESSTKHGEYGKPIDLVDSFIRSSPPITAYREPPGRLDAAMGRCVFPTSSFDVCVVLAALTRGARVHDVGLIHPPQVSCGGESTRVADLLHW